MKTKKASTIPTYKPKVNRISDWDSKTEIIYECPKCGTAFSALGTNVKFCFNCGVKINWDVYAYCSEDFKQKYHSSSYQVQKDMITLLDVMNSQIAPQTNEPIQKLDVAVSDTPGDKINHIPVAVMESYLFNKGWVREADFENHNLMVFNLPETNLRLAFPASDILEDYTWCLNKTLKSLAVIENRHVSVIISELKAINDDQQ